MADYYYDKGREVAQDVATKIAYSGKDIAPHFSGYEISFDDRYYDFDRQAAKDMRELFDSKSKETEITVSRKKLKVIEASEDDKDLEY